MLKTILIGRLGSDPKLLKTKSNENLCTFNVGCKIGKDKTQWISCSAMGKNVEIILQYVKKGHTIALEGTVSTNAYLDKDGAAQAALTMFITNIHLQSNPNSNTSGETIQPFGHSDTSLGKNATSSNPHFGYRTPNLTNDDVLPF